MVDPAAPPQTAVSVISAAAPPRDAARDPMDAGPRDAATDAVLPLPDAAPDGG